MENESNIQMLQYPTSKCYSDQAVTSQLPTVTKEI